MIELALLIAILIIPGSVILVGIFLPKEWKVRDAGNGIEVWSNGRATWAKIVDEKQFNAHMRELLNAFTADRNSK